MNKPPSRSVKLVAIVFSVCVSINVASAGTITINGTQTASTIAGIDSDNNSTVSTIAISYVAGAPQTMKDALAAQFSTWNFTFVAGLSGTLNINTYIPVSNADDNGGAKIDATYTRVGNDPAIADLHWIQMVTTNLPLGGGSTNGYIDPRPNDDSLPFYWTVPEDSASSTVSGGCGNFTQGSKTDTTYHFYDCSQRTPASETPPTSWTGTLVLASWTDPGGSNWINNSPLVGAQNVTVYDGIQWGWTLTDVPEPGSIILMLSGLAGIGFWRFRSSRKNVMARI